LSDHEDIEAPPNNNDTHPHVEGGGGGPSRGAEFTVNNSNVAARVQRQLRHEPAPVPRVQNPFEGREDEQKMFWERLSYAASHGLYPPGYGFRPGEPGHNDWLDTETLVVGKKRSGKQHKIYLTREVWEPRVRCWVQALEGFTYMQMWH
jgi:hypothetical protein